MASNDPNDDGDYNTFRFRLKVGATLLGMYAAMHLAVAGFVQALSPHEAAAATAANSSALTCVPADSIPNAASSDASASGSFQAQAVDRMRD